MEDIVNTIFNSWSKCYNNHIFIENENNKIIMINNKDDIHKTYYIENSSNITCIINTKINHLIINKCDNIIIFINSILISGLDIFHSNTISINNNNNNNNNNNSISNFSINFGHTYILNINQFNVDLNLKLCINIIYNLTINKLTVHYIYDTYITCLNLFTIQTLYLYINNNDTIKCLDTFYGTYDISKKSDL